MVSRNVIAARPGDYFARVRAKNDCGVSALSNEANPRVR
jgi:hypothetical protein